jgi:hypothetical protein
MLTPNDRVPGDEPKKPEPARQVMQAEHVRAADSDRRRTVAELQEHFVAGRLSSEELSERVEQALASRTFGELALVVHDLPAVEVPPESVTTVQPAPGDRDTRRDQRRERRRLRHQGGRYGRRSLRAHAMSYLLVMGMLVVIWLLTSPEHAYFWPIWPMMGWGIGLAAHALSSINRAPKPV